jgi:hypothetical protein
MHPRPTADTVGPPVPSVRAGIVDWKGFVLTEPTVRGLMTIVNFCHL